MDKEENKDKDKKSGDSNVWLILMCLCFSLIFTFILIPLNEYLTSHFYKPVRTLVNSLNESIFFAYPYSNSILPLFFIITFLLLSAIIFFVIHYLIGYIVIGILCLGFFPSLVILFAVYAASSLLNTVHAMII